MDGLSRYLGGQRDDPGLTGWPSYRMAVSRPSRTRSVAAPLKP